MADATAPAQSPMDEFAQTLAQLAADVVEIKAYIAKDNSRDTRLEEGLRIAVAILGGADNEENRTRLVEIRRSLDHDSHVAQLQAGGKVVELKLYLAQHDAWRKTIEKKTDSPDKAARRAELSAQMAALDAE